MPIKYMHWPCQDLFRNPLRPSYVLYGYPKESSSGKEEPDPATCELRSRTTEYNEVRELIQMMQNTKDLHIIHICAVCIYTPLLSSMCICMCMCM